MILHFKAVIRHLIGACPNIEALHIGNKDYEDEDYETSSARSVDNLDFLFAIRFPCLTMLTLDGFPLLDGSYLPTVKTSTLPFKCLVLFLLMSQFCMHRSLCNAPSYRSFIWAMQEPHLTLFFGKLASVLLRFPISVISGLK